MINDVEPKPVMLSSKRPHRPIKGEGEREILDLIAEIINVTLSADEIYDALVSDICRVFGVEICAIILLNEDKVDLVVEQYHHQETLRYYWETTDLEGGPIEYCIANKEVVINNHITSDVDLRFLAETLDILPASLLCTPLSIDDHVLGAIAILNKIDGAFTEQDEESLIILSAALTRKIHNENTIQKLKISNAELEVIRWQLLNSRNILRALFDSLPTSMYIIDSNFNLAAINMHRANRINQPPEQLVGRRCYEALYQRFDPCPDCQVIETLISGDHTTRTKRLWETELDPLEWEISSYPIHDKDNRIVQAILIEQDVTEKRRLEATLAQSEKLAAVGQLAAGLAHEINNPLTAVIANAQLLMRELPPDDDKQELVELIALAGERASQVVGNLLDMARREQYEFNPTDINLTIDKALALLQHDIVARSVDLKFRPSEDIPTIIASQDHLQGVWLNLLTNAIDSLGSEHRTVQIETKQKDNEVHVVLSDSGEGMGPDHLSRIFEPFYTTKGPGQGTGLGLSVCHRIIKQHGGRILVDSKPGVGTKFTVVLPIT